LALICAQLPTVAVFTIVLRPTYAPTLTKLGISTALRATKAERPPRPGPREACLAEAVRAQPANPSGTLSIPARRPAFR
jgi:hypothetical protein